jgi:hypothetical protein
VRVNGRGDGDWSPVAIPSAHRVKYGCLLRRCQKGASLINRNRRTGDLDRVQLSRAGSDSCIAIADPAAQCREFTTAPMSLAGA